jgi:phenylalanyl-tRNA synthetase alpha chain
VGVPTLDSRSHLTKLLGTSCSAEVDPNRHWLTRLVGQNGRVSSAEQPTPNLATELASLQTDALAPVIQAGTLDELKQVELGLVGKTGRLTEINKTLGAMSPDDRKSAGASINATRQKITDAIAARRIELTAAARRAQLEAERLDLGETIPEAELGHLHLITRTTMDLEDIFLGMGFQIFEGPEAETDWYNFEALNFPPGHPARTMHDTFHVDNAAAGGEPGSVVLRTHTSPMQIRVMQQMQPPIYAVMPGRCYRRDTPDARHLPVFHQIEALVIDKGISLGHLAGTIDSFIAAYFGRDDLRTRLRPGFFPFTEPSAEFDITCPFCGGSGCRVCSQTGWIELGGCGMVHPNVLRAGGVDPEEWTGFAWGFGIDRLAMNRHNLSDLRDLLANDVRLLRQF